MMIDDKGFIRDDVLVISSDGFIQTLEDFLFWDGKPPQADLAHEWYAGKAKHLAALRKGTDLNFAVIAYELASLAASKGLTHDS